MPPQDSSRHAGPQIDVGEHMPLLPPNQVPYTHDTTSTNHSVESSDQEENIGRNEFYAPSNLASSEIKPRLESEVTSGYGTAHQNSSQSSHHRKQSVSSSDTIPRCAECIEEFSPSHFLGGVTVTQFWLIFSGILFNLFLSCFDATIMASSHPVITSYFNSANSASWLSTAFLLTSTSFQPLFGRLSDVIGRKMPYIFSLAVFLIATIWCALAQSMTSFIIARAFCGLGAGGMGSLGVIIISDLVPIEVRGSYQAYLNAVFGIGSALGAALGGAIADKLGWRWEFGVQVPLIAISLILACCTTPKALGLGKVAEQKLVWESLRSFDFKGSILLTVSITFLILGLNLGGNIYDWSHPFVLSSLAVFAICLPIFAWVELLAPLPIIPLRLLLCDPSASLIISNTIGAMISTGVTFNVPLYFQAVLLESATNSGLRLVLPTICSSIAGTATGFLITYTRRFKPWLVIGTIFLIIGTISLICMTRGLPSWSYFLLLIPSTIGTGFMYPATFMAVLAASEQSDQAVVTSTLILWRSLGMVLGVASSSVVLQNALNFFLDKKVNGPDKEDVISKVRKSIGEIVRLDPVYREQVIDAYGLSLRSVFVAATILAAAALVITCRVKLPTLGYQRK